MTFSSFKIIPTTALLLGLAGFMGCENTSSTSQSLLDANAGMSESSSGDILAKIGKEKITFGKLDSELKGGSKANLIKAKAEYYQAKKAALDEYIFQTLLEKEAKKTKAKDGDAVMEAYMKKNGASVSDKEVKAFYDSFKDKAKSMGRPLPPFEQVKGQIKDKLMQDKQAGASQKLFDELKKKYDVAYLLSPPRQKVAVGDNPVYGKEKAKITIVEFSDFECPYCKRGTETIKKVMDAYKGKVKLYFRDYPLPFHKAAKPAHVAARCAGQQGKYWEYHDKLFEAQKLSSEDLMAHAKSLKLNEKKFKSCLEDKEMMEKVQKDLEAGAAVGINGTPAFFVNGIMLSGAQPFERFKEVIDQELEKLN